MTKKKGKILSLVALVLFLGASMLYAYSAGYCLKADCRCHQYVGDDGTSSGSGSCRNCGHSKASHS
ncbi:MAG: hypothetical protein IJR40_01760 [Treponema sp.]|nr:hypothetical protein [Treponema sp.]MBQ9625879.1 hypothetical protein [Treponema sp.]